MKLYPEQSNRKMLHATHIIIYLKGDNNVP